MFTLHKREEGSIVESFSLNDFYTIDEEIFADAQFSVKRRDSISQLECKRFYEFKR